MVFNLQPMPFTVSGLLQLLRSVCINCPLLYATRAELQSQFINGLANSCPKS